MMRHVSSSLQARADTIACAAACHSKCVPNKLRPRQLQVTTHNY